MLGINQAARHSLSNFSSNGHAALHHRVILPELLDELPEDDPRAIGSRRDIARLNRVMGHGALMRRMLEPVFAARGNARIVELGAGDGLFPLELARSAVAGGKRPSFVLVDFNDAVIPETRAAFKELGCEVEIVTADVFDWLKQPGPEADAIIANLFLHHFKNEQLAEMLRLIAGRTKFFAACEPHRSQLPLLFSKLVWFIGCNAVTRHDAVVSVRAGFRDAELSALWPKLPGWQIREDRAGLFSHAFVAQRAPVNGSGPQAKA